MIGTNQNLFSVKKEPAKRPIAPIGVKFAGCGINLNIIPNTINPLINIY